MLLKSGSLSVVFERESLIFPVKTLVESFEVLDRAVSLSHLRTANLAKAGRTVLVVCSQVNLILTLFYCLIILIGDGFIFKRQTIESHKRKVVLWIE